MGFFRDSSYDERYFRTMQGYSLDLKRLEVEGVQTAIDAARVKIEREKLAWVQDKVDIESALLDLDRKRIQLEGYRLDNALKRRDLDLLYPNQAGAYPAHLNPPANCEPLLLPAAKFMQPVAPAPAPVKTFSELLQDGTVNYALSQNKIVLGYTQNELRFGSWFDLYSCGIGGVSGSGKTTTVRFLLFQAVLAGSQLIMIDPHIGEKEESLAAQFSDTLRRALYLFDPCGDVPSFILQRVRWLKKEMADRKLKGKKTPIIMLVIDEYNAVMRDEQVRKAVAELLVIIAQEGRKFGVFAMLIGQRWSAQDIGGADVRTSLASTLAHRFTDVDQAKKLVGDGREANKCLRLAQGHYLFRDTSGALNEMTTPNTVAEDGEYIQQLLDHPETSIRNQPETSPKVVESSGYTEPLKPDRNQPETSYETRDEAALEALGMRIIQMQADGMQKPEIMKAIWNVSPGASAAYSRAFVEYKQAMQVISDKLGVAHEY